MLRPYWLTDYNMQCPYFPLKKILKGTVVTLTWKMTDVPLTLF